MKFKKYIQTFDTSLRKFAIKSGIDHRVLQRYYSGKSLPSIPNAYKIWKATGKKVNLKDWMEK